MEQIRPDVESVPEAAEVDPAAADEAARREARLRRRRAHRVRRRTVRGVAVLAVLVLAAAGWLALRGYQARGHLQSAALLVSKLQEQTSAGDGRGAPLTLALLQEDTGAARRETGDPVWRIAGALPWVGDNVSAVAGLSRAVDDLARRGLPPLVDRAGSLDPATFAPKKGRIDLAALEDLAPRVRTADTEIRRVRADVTRLGQSSLLPPVRAAVGQLRTKLDQAAALTGTADKAATLLPPMLGADGARTYLLMFQNPAEARATGGLAGAYAVVRADRGRVRLIGQGTAAGDLRIFTEPVLPLTPQQKALYTDRLGTFPGDVNFTPHFPTAAKLFREMYRKRTGETVDAVVATDPVALSYLLRGSAPLRLPGGETLRSDNAVRLLLSEVYSKYPDPLAQDAFFGTAAATTFDALTNGRIGGAAALAGLTLAADEHRVLVWSSRPAEQRVLEGTQLGGSLPEHEGRTPTIGVFLNDGTGAKLNYHVRQSLQVVGGSCTRDGRRQIRVLVTLSSTVPRGGLTRSVLGGTSGAGLAPGLVRTNVLFFSPADGSIEGAKVDGAPAGVATGSERGRMVGYVTLDLPPGAERSVEVTVSTPVLGDRDPVTPRFWTTPTSTPWTVRSAAVSCGG
ncbi:MAG TPA: DUF4012 domain-containing protein [Mycobacteriales bacterium]